MHSLLPIRSSLGIAPDEGAPGSDLLVIQGAVGSFDPECRPNSDDFGHATVPVEAAFLVNRREEEIRDALRTFRKGVKLQQEERGFNPLRLVFGLLLWRDQRRRAMVSPLITRSVTISPEPQPAARILPLDGPVELNRALALRLRRDYDFQLPQHASIDLERYLDEASTALLDAGLPWSIQPACILGLFPSTGQLLFDDLDPETWTAQAQGNTLGTISQLLGDGFGPVTLPDAPDEDDPLHVLEADQSQLDAIRVARQAPVTYIQGPPGCGRVRP